MSGSETIAVTNNTHQKEKIISSIKQFITGGDESDLQKLESVLHNEYRNVQYGFFDEPGVFVIDKEKYIDLVKEKTFGGNPREMKILSLDIYKNTAMAQLRLESTQLIFHSFVSLIYDKDQWRVIGNFPEVLVKET